MLRRAAAVDAADVAAAVVVEARAAAGLETMQTPRLQTRLARGGVAGNRPRLAKSRRPRNSRRPAVVDAAAVADAADHW